MAADSESGGNFSPEKSVEEINQSERLEEIHTAKKEFVEKKRSTEAALATDKIDSYTAKTVLRSSLEDYIIELEAIMRSEDQYEWYWEGDEDEPLGEFELDDGREIEIVGLKDIVTKPNPFIVEETTTPPPPPGQNRWPRYMRDEVVETERKAQQIPRSILLAANRRVNQFMNDVGLDVKLSELHETKITDDALEDVADWMDRRGLVYDSDKDNMNYNI